MKAMLLTYDTGEQGLAPWYFLWKEKVGCLFVTSHHAFLWTAPGVSLSGSSGEERIFR